MMLIALKRWGTEELLKRKKTKPQYQKDKLVSYT